MIIQTPEMRLRNCLASELLSDVVGYACTMASGAEMKFDHNGSHQAPIGFIKNADGTIGGDGATVTLSAAISSTAKAAYAGVRASCIVVFRKQPAAVTTFIQVGSDIPNNKAGFTMRESASTGSGPVDDSPDSDLSPVAAKLADLPATNELLVCGAYLDGPADTVTACTYGVESGVTYREDADRIVSNITGNFGIEDGFRLFDIESVLGIYAMEHSAAIAAADFFNYVKTTGTMTNSEWS